MFLIRLWHYLKGYVIIIVSGQSVEKFINICTRRQILLWDMERVERNSVRMKMSIRGLRMPVLLPENPDVGCGF